MTHLLKKLLVVLGLLGFINPTIHAAEHNGQEAINIPNSQIEYLLRKFTEADLIATSPQLITSEDLKEEPYVTNDMYRFETKVADEEKALPGAIYYIQDEDKKHELVKFYEEVDQSNPFLLEKAEIILILDKDTPKELVKAYESILKGAQNTAETIEEVEISVTPPARDHEEVQTSDSTQTETRHHHDEPHHYQEETINYPENHETPNYWGQHPHDYGFQKYNGFGGTEEEFNAFQYETGYGLEDDGQGNYINHQYLNPYE